MSLLILKDEEIVSQKRKIVFPESHCWQKEASNSGVPIPGLGLLLQQHSAGIQDCKVDLHHHLLALAVPNLGSPAPHGVWKHPSLDTYQLQQHQPIGCSTVEPESPIVNHLLKELYICCREIYWPQVTGYNFGHLGEIMKL